MDRELGLDFIVKLKALDLSLKVKEDVQEKKISPSHYMSLFFILFYSLLREAFIEKKNYGKFHNQSDPIFWPKLLKILKNINFLWSQKVV